MYQVLVYQNYAHYFTCILIYHFLKWKGRRKVIKQRDQEWVRKECGRGSKLE
jgi:hypothetical protein